MDQNIITPPGIAINDSGKSLRICFMLNGMRCRETINLPPTKPSIKYAVNLRAEILNKIAKNQFNYAEYFPNSKLAKKAGIITPDKNITCKDLFEKQIDYYEKLTLNHHLSPSTLLSYKKIIVNCLIPKFGRYLIQNITASIIRKWVVEFEGNTRKTINNLLIPLKQMLDDAINNELINVNPLNKIALGKLLKAISKPSKYEVNPFTNLEKQLIINTATGQIKNLIQFGFWSGLRTGELIALKWHDIDFNNKIAHIHQAKVCNFEKGTKTKSGVRKLVLLPKAIEALVDQLDYTGNSKYIFHNPNTNQAWANSGKVSGAWRKLLLTLNIAYRNCYQMRHTYASTLLSNGENIFWVAKQMGHADINPLIKHYGRWIPNSEQAGNIFTGNY